MSRRVFFPIPHWGLMGRQLVAAVLAGCVHGSVAASPAVLDAVDHLVVIYAENHSFDNLYGLFPGANGIANATPAQYLQLDHDGRPLKELVVFDHHGHPDPAYPRLPNKPFRIDAPPVDKTPGDLVPSPVHAFFHNQEQIHGGQNNMFAAMSTRGGWVMGHYDGSQFKLWQWAREYTLADHFFMGAFGGSYLNHLWLVCACTPQHTAAPEAMRIRLDAQGRLEKKPGSPSAHDGAVQVYSGGGVQVTPQGWSVNTTQPPYQPSGIPPAPQGPLTHANEAGVRVGGNLQVPLPAQDLPTIGDRLSDKGIAWAWYAGGYRQALADGQRPSDQKRQVIYNTGPSSPIFQPHHQPFNYFKRYAPGTADRARHLKDGEDFLEDIRAGRLPAVSFYKPVGRVNQHPSYTDVKSGDDHIDSVLHALRQSPQWSKMLIVVTYDENGGYWDHVPPPSGPGWGDAFGPGTRVPALFIGPQVKKSHVDATPMDTTSILKFVTERFRLQALPGVREKVGNMSSVLQSSGVMK